MRHPGVACAKLSLLLLAPWNVVGQSATSKGISRTPDGKRDLSGVWVNSSFKKLPGGGVSRFSGRNLPFAPGGEALWNLNLNGDPHHDNPHFLSPVDKEGNFGCKPWGFPQSALSANAQQFFQPPGYLVIIYEAMHATRMIPMDGRSHSKDFEPTYLGESVGHYEGDTAVIDTIGLKEGASDGSGHHRHTEAAHYVERYTRTGPATMSFELTTDDPKIFTKPWKSGPWTMQLHPEWTIQESFCEDNKQDPGVIDYLHHLE
jgi:hypothetical protein